MCSRPAVIIELAFSYNTSSENNAIDSAKFKNEFVRNCLSKDNKYYKLKYLEYHSLGYESSELLLSKPFFHFLYLILTAALETRFSV